MTDFIEKYLEWKSTYTSRAFINYRPWLFRFASSVGDKPLNEVTLDDIVRFRQWLDTRYQPYTIQLAMVALHNFIKFWNIQRYDCISPSLVRVPRTRPKPRPVVSAEDYVSILKTFKSTDSFIPLRNELLIRLLWDTGVRVSELCDINISDVDESKREALVRTRKSDRMRQIFWTVETHVTLRRYLKLRTPLSSSPALFIGFRLEGMPKRLHVRSVQNLTTKLATRLGLGKITPHSFRHGKAHKILRMGGNIKHVGAVLGHAETNLMAATHYLQLNDIELKAVATRFLEDDPEN